MPADRFTVCRDGWHITAVAPRTAMASVRIVAAAAVVALAAISIPVALLGALT